MDKTYDCRQSKNNALIREFTQWRIWRMCWWFHWDHLSAVYGTWLSFKMKQAAGLYWQFQTGVVAKSCAVLQLSGIFPKTAPLLLFHLLCWWQKKIESRKLPQWHVFDIFSSIEFWKCFGLNETGALQWKIKDVLPE